MQKINFQDLPSTSTPINATNLNQLQTNVEDTIFVTAPGLTTLGITDLDDVVAPKIYTGYGSYSNSPVPNNTTFKLEVITTKPVADDNTWIFQTLTTLTGDKIYQRGKLNAYDWYPWKLISSADITTGTEFETGRIIDEKKEYGKRINIGNLPNTTVKNVSHGLSNVHFTRIEGTATYSNSTLPLPYSHNIPENCIGVDIYSGNIRILSGIDRSPYTGEITLYYTKN